MGVSNSMTDICRAVVLEVYSVHNSAFQGGSYSAG